MQSDAAKPPPYFLLRPQTPTHFAEEPVFTPWAAGARAERNGCVVAQHEWSNAH